ncbi:MAG: alpha amylase C-terminal domain-containing protein, partial [Prolixibacteraceae bacterium]|nr:alpha amylase C-terminal domain-containing protein [Prolixibacteraceae bacterium]
RLIDKDMYYNMGKDQQNIIVDRGIALHKMIRLATAACAGGGYLNFMGNEFGHPEWIDFPRQGNNRSYSHARRQWSLMDNHDLKYHYLSDFDSAMIHWISETKLLKIKEIYRLFDNKKDEVFAFHRGDYLMVFNFNPSKSFTGYGIPLSPSKYKILFDTDESRFGGQDRIDKNMTYRTVPSNGWGSQHYLNLYLPSRTGIVFKKDIIKSVR